MTAKELLLSGRAKRWELVIIVAGKQLMARGEAYPTVNYAEKWGTISLTDDRLNYLSVPADLVPSREGDQWVEFTLGDATLVVWFDT